MRIDITSETFRYTCYGAIFGLVFPLIATIIDLTHSDLVFSLENIITIHQSQPLHWIIDTAPFFLGLFASFAGQRQDKLRDVNNELEEKIIARTTDLQENNLRLEQEIEERRAIENKLVQAKEQAEAASKAKADFLAKMSHEIRTPMNAVIGMANLLIEDNPTPRQAENLEILRFSADNLLQLINDILDFNKIEAGKMEILPRIFDLPKFLEDIRLSHQHDAEQKNVSLKFQVDSNLPEMIKTDPVKLSQVLDNLTSNGIKFSQDGEVLLTAELAKETEHTAVIRFKVKDTGIGIPKEKYNEIFEEFNQGGLQYTHKYDGTGLGLTISKQLLNLLDSHIYIKSDPGSGSEFYFDLEVGKVSVFHKGYMDSPKTEPPKKGRLLNKSILLVEDNPLNQKVALEFLKRWGAKADLAENGIEAVDKVTSAAEQYDLILMDLQMPEMDGYEATEAIRNFDGGKFGNLPIVALTASALIDVKNKVFAVGMNGFVTKPFNPKELYEKLSGFL